MPCGTIGMIHCVARRLVASDHPRNRVRHPVRQVHARVSESDAGIGSRQQHLRPRLAVSGSSHGPRQVLGDHPQRLQRPDIADRVRPLIRRAQSRPFGPAPAGVRHRGVGFDGMAQHVQPRRCRDLGGQHGGVLGVQNAQRRFQSPVRNPGLGAHLDHNRRSPPPWSRCPCPPWSAPRSRASTDREAASPARSAD